MPQFILNTSECVAFEIWPGDRTGAVQFVAWRDLDWFTQGYVEALFFTDSGPEDGQLGDAGFGDLAPEALDSILKDCRAFQASAAWRALLEASEVEDRGQCDLEMQGGRDFWFTRCGHGVGFWDGDWPEPHAIQLTDAAHAFGNVDSYLSDPVVIPGKVYLS